MNLKEFEKATKDELRQKASECFALAESEPSGDDKIRHLLSAQFYLHEVEQREQSFISIRDLVLEIIVIVLIGLEIYFGIVGGNQQLKVLGKLSGSNDETAKTLTAVRQAQEASLDAQKHTLDNIVAMNTALQDELDLNFADVLQLVTYSNESFSLTNRGRTELYLWGSRFDGQPPVMQQKASVITLGANQSFDISRLTKKLLGEMADESQRQIPFELYLKAANGTKYVAKSNLVVNRHKDNLMINCWSIPITRKQW